MIPASTRPGDVGHMMSPGFISPAIPDNALIAQLFGKLDEAIAKMSLIRPPGQLKGAADESGRVRIAVRKTKESVGLTSHGSSF